MNGTRSFSVVTETWPRKKNRTSRKMNTKHGHSQFLMKHGHGRKNRTSREMSNTEHGHSQFLMKHSHERKNRILRKMNNTEHGHSQLLLKHGHCICFTTIEPLNNKYVHFIKVSCYVSFLISQQICSKQLVSGLSHLCLRPPMISYSSTILIPDETDNHLLDQTRILFPVNVNSAK